MPTMLEEKPKTQRRTDITPEACEVLNDLVTEQYVMRLFRVSKPSIYNWRRLYGMPFVEIPGDDRPSIRFRLKAVRAWAIGARRRMYPVRPGPGG